VLITRRSKLYFTASGIITLCRWPFGAPNGHVQSMTIPDFDLLMIKQEFVHSVGQLLRLRPSGLLRSE